jgi:ribosomal protein L31E
MITPWFKLEQCDDYLFIKIKAPYAKVIIKKFNTKYIWMKSLKLLPHSLKVKLIMHNSELLD